MSEQKWAVVIALIGFAIMLVGLGMDTTIEYSDGLRVMNNYLAQRQNITILFGGFLLVVGVILFAAAKFSRTRHDDNQNTIAPALKQAADEVERQRRAAARAQMSEEAQQRTQSLLRAIRSWFISGSEPIRDRLLTALFVGLCTTLLVGAATNTKFAIISFLFILAYAFRAAPSVNIKFHLHCLNFLAWSIIALALSAMTLVIDRMPADEGEKFPAFFYWMAPILFGLPALISLSVMLRLRRQARH
jgi:hypothetical protein